MRTKNVKSNIIWKIKNFTIVEYDYKDIIDFDNIISNRKEPYIQSVLKNKFSHISYKEDSHPRKNIMKRTSHIIFFLWIKIIVEELLKGEIIYLKGIGKLNLETNNVRSGYFGWNKDKERVKRKGYYTFIRAEYETRIKSRSKYNSFPYWAFGEFYKKKLWKNEDNGIKY